mmetsp:Transcript_43256/g.101745  ORF Transcript_43256/g.101745 Transcript_43256/m.101745 type:complete len:579 (-) Transcript_43256:65-1801(-)
MVGMLRARSRASSAGASPNKLVTQKIVPELGKSLAQAQDVLLEPLHPNLHMKDPLTEVERRAVSERIRRETTELAAGLVRVEQDTRDRLNAVHLKCIALLCVALVATGFVMIYLRGMLVPLILALFFMFLLEPLLMTMLNPPGALKRYCPRRIPADALEPGTPSSRASNLPSIHDAASLPTVVELNCSAQTKFFIASLTWKIWGLFCICVCILLLVGFFAFVLYMAIDAIASFKWRKYTDSRNLALLMDWFPQLGDDPERLRIDRFLPWLLQGPLFNALDLTLSIISQAFLTMLFLVFLLAHHVFETGEHLSGIQRKIRRSVRRYIRIKTMVVSVMSVLCGGFYWYMDVDLWFLFSVATFVLCYIPHVGNTIAVLAPLLVVFLDPLKTWGDLAITFIFPFVVHQLATNLVEPKLLASSLDLHPIVVLLALAFWSAVWGAVGAIMSVPLTAVLRMVLLDVQHPYAAPIVRLLKGQFSKIGAPTTPAASPRNKHSPPFKVAPPQLVSPVRPILRTSDAGSPEEHHRPKAESEYTVGSISEAPASRNWSRTDPLESERAQVSGSHVDFIAPDEEPSGVIVL